MEKTCDKWVHKATKAYELRQTQRFYVRVLLLDMCGYLVVFE